MHSNPKIKTALITGASGGIGYELCKEFASGGYHLVLVARSEERLNALAEEMMEKYPVRVRVLISDLSRPSAAQEVYESLKKLGIAVHVLVNNAGFSLNGKFAENDLREEVDIIEVHISSLVKMTHLFLKDMVQRKSGKILNVASTAGFQPGPFMANYYAAKSYVLHFSEGLSEELRKDGVTVSVLCPGVTKTNFWYHKKLRPTRLREGLFLPMMKPSDVARIGYRGLHRGQTVIITGFFNRLLTQSLRITPRYLMRKIMAFLNTSSA